MMVTTKHRHRFQNLDRRYGARRLYYTNCTLVHCVCFLNDDMGDYSNYKPISIIVIAYKILAHIILHRLKAGGAEQCILQNYFGLKSKARRIDELFLARRAINHAIKHGAPSHLITLDLSKAFDSLMPHALFCAFNRFGISSNMISMIKHIYHEK